MQRIDGVMWSGFIIKSTKCFEINVYYQDYLEKWLLHMFMVKSVSVCVKKLWDHCWLYCYADLEVS